MSIDAVSDTEPAAMVDFAMRPPAGSGAFDWAITTLCAAFVGGLFLDGWAHTHGRVDDSFLTP
jgi:hypothetical protein